jgi:RimJ/RimL family protein N-acetyltransferase
MKKFLQPDQSNPPFHLSIIEKTTGYIIGMAGVYTLHPQAELGYMLHPDKWGVGYATEALTAFLQQWWELPRHSKDKASNIEESLFADAHKENGVSLRLMEKLRFKRYTDFVEDGDEIIGLKLRRPSLY